jgi:hypothetical protein
LPQASHRRRAGHGVGLKNGSVFLSLQLAVRRSVLIFNFETFFFSFSMMDRFGIVLNENFGGS